MIHPFTYELSWTHVGIFIHIYIPILIFIHTVIHIQPFYAVFTCILKLMILCEYFIFWNASLFGSPNVPFRSPIVPWAH